MEFTARQTFSDREHFSDALKEFVIMNNLELQHIKMDSRRVGHDLVNVLKIAIGVCMPLSTRMWKVSQ